MTDVRSDPLLRRLADRDLAARCVAGDEMSQRAFFAEHKRRVHYVLYRVVGSNRDMDDLAQDAFIEIFRSLPGFRGESSLATWIDRICVRVARRHITTRRPPHLELVSVIDDPARGPDRHAEAREALRRLYTALDRCEASHRVAFVLHEVDGRPLREVAALMEASVVATKLRVWRTRKRIEEAARKDAALAYFLQPPVERRAP